MAVAVAEVAGAGADLRTDDAQDAVVVRWYEWSLTAADVGVQTRAVLDAAHPAVTAPRARFDQGGRRPVGR